MAVSVHEQQQAIVDAALGLLASGGPQALRVREIAEAAGCTTMTVYSRFGGKDGIVDAIYMDGYRRFAHALRQSIATARNHDELTKAGALGMAMAYRSWALENPGSYHVMFTEAVPGFEPSDDAAAVALDAFGVLVDMVTSLQRGGHLQPVDPLILARGIWGMCHGLVMLELAEMGPPAATVDPEVAYTAAMDATLRGFGI